MTIDPRIAFWFGVWTFLLLGLANGSGHLPSTFSKETADQIISWAAFLAWINSGILTAASGYSSTRPGPMVNVPPPAMPTIVKILLVAFALSFLVAGGEAQAQIRKPAVTVASDVPAPTEKCLIPWDPLKLCGTLTGKPEEDMQRVVVRIQKIGRDDMNYAILKATSANTNGSKVRLQCLQAIMAAKNAAEGTDIKDANGNIIPRPDPAVVTAIEDVAELVDALSPQGPLMTGCAGAAQLFKTNTLAAINAIVTGAAGIAAMPAGL